MIIVYIWLGLVGLAAMMLIAKMIATLALAAKGKCSDLRSCNMLMLYLAAFVFLPIKALANLVKKVN